MGGVGRAPQKYGKGREGSRKLVRGRERLRKSGRGREGLPEVREWLGVP